MASGENFCLRLNEFETNVKTYWQQLQDEEDFCDVSLVCDDGQIKTHKIMISSCSPVFKKILTLQQNPHPLIYLRRVKYKNLQNLINFMYQGEVDVAEEDLSTFLEVAEDLQIRGLSEINQDHSKPAESIYHDPVIIPNLTERKKVIKNHNSKKTNDIKPLKIDDDDFSEPVNNINNTSKIESIARSEIIEHNENLVVAVDKQFSCLQCSYRTARKDHLKKHIESVHQRLSVRCDKCNKQFSSKDNLQLHTLSVHEGVRYPCEFCDYKSTQKGNLHKHYKVIHNKV